MRKEFLVERQGRTFVLYSGLLSLAHEQGLKSIETHLVQVPGETNKGVAISTAIVTMEKDGIERRFTGIGDAAEINVAPAMRNCLIRMSETRAKARALRDAVNIGVAAFEELGEEDAQDGSPDRGYEAPRATRSTLTAASRTASAPAPAATKRGADIDLEAPITSEQVHAIASICQRKGIDLIDTSEWTTGAAAAWIKKQMARSAA